MITVIKSNKEISFVVSEYFSKKAEQFINDINKKVLEEQLVTKRLKDIEIPEPRLKSMMKQKLESMNNKDADIHFMPYYGVDGSFGSPLFQFQISPSISTLKITHWYTKESIDLKSERITAAGVIGNNDNKLIKYRIAGNELKNLIAWDEWSDSFALSDRYIYEFISVSIGTAVSVKNIETGNEINITDYDDW
ncbi:MAG: hypothetical protein K0B01_10475 [Syntrophobacterales bacterium]|nr:hypothetical protein [Syntrophobacterales bacterium]